MRQGSTWSEEELAAYVRGLESGVRQQDGEFVALPGTLCAGLVPRHRPGTSNIYSTGAKQLSAVSRVCDVAVMKQWLYER